MSQSNVPPRFFSWADGQAAATLMFDSLVNLSLLAGILVQFGFPTELLSRRILPGSAAAVLFGSLGSVWLTQRLRLRSPQGQVTAVPFGLDTPSTLGMALGVLGPAFLTARTEAALSGYLPEEAQMLAALQAWDVGSAVMVMVGLIKAFCALLAPWLERLLPAAATMGALASIGLLFLGLLPALEVFAAPLVGLPALAVVLFGLVAGRRLPFGLPAAGVAVATGSAIYYGLGPLGVLGCGPFHWPNTVPAWTPPLWHLPGNKALHDGFTALSVAVPFALLTVVGGISNVAAARAAGDDFRVRSLLWVDAVATALSGLLGGVAQSTPYIGHAAYKKIGAQTGYVLLAGLAVGLGGATGLVHWAIAALPLAAIAPVMVYVGLEIAGLAFAATPRRHLPAVLLTFLPTLANLLLLRGEEALTKLQKALWVAFQDCPTCVRVVDQQIAAAQGSGQLQNVRMLGHGFLLTSLMWGTTLALLLDNKLRRAALPLAVMALLTTCGAVHSPRADGGLFWPGTPPSNTVHVWSVSYLLAAAMLLLLGSPKRARHK